MKINGEVLELELGDCLVKEFKLSELEMKSKFNEHTNLIMIFEVDSNKYKELKTNFYNPKSRFKVRNRGVNIFDGTLYEVMSDKNMDNKVIIRLEAFDNSKFLDENKKSRVYQDKNITYKNIIDDILKDSNISYVVSKKFNVAINKVFRQLETDWNFLVRICSNLGEAIFVTNEGVILFGDDCISNIERVL